MAPTTREPGAAVGVHILPTHRSNEPYRQYTQPIAAKEQA